MADRAIRETLEELHYVLEGTQFVGSRFRCPWCEGSPAIGHAENCRLAAALTQDRTALADGEWRDISTAPKDGRKLLLLFSGPFHDAIEDGVTVGGWSVQGGWWYTSGVWASSQAPRDPTHWQPAPTSTEGKSDG